MGDFIKQQKSNVWREDLLILNKGMAIESTVVILDSIGPRKFREPPNQEPLSGTGCFFKRQLQL